MKVEASPYQKLASSYASPLHGRFYEKISDHLVKLLSPTVMESPQLAIDLGCGSGHSLKPALKHWPRSQWIALDSSSEMIEQGRKRERSRRVRWEQVDSRRPLARFAQGSVDLLLSSFSLHWMPENAFQEFERVLKPGGFVLIAAPASVPHSTASGNRELRRLLRNKMREGHLLDSPKPPSFRSGYALAELGVRAGLELWVCADEQLSEKWPTYKEGWQALRTRGSLLAMGLEDEEPQGSSEWILDWGISYAVWRKPIALIQ